MGPLVGTRPLAFGRIGPPTERELQELVERIAARIGRALERRGLLERDSESSYLSRAPAAAGSLDDLLGHSIAYRIAVGPRAGQKVFMLQTVPAQPQDGAKARPVSAAAGSSES